MIKDTENWKWHNELKTITKFLKLIMLLLSSPIEHQFVD